MILNIKLITGESLTQKVDKSSCVIGRSAQADVVIPHEAVSRKHCQIDYTDGELYVTDLGSINGVLIDGKKITPNKKVKFQSFLTLSFGAVQTLNVDLDEDKTSDKENTLLIPTSNQNENRKKAQNRTGQIKRPENMAAVKKPASGPGSGATLPMSNFIALCVIIAFGFIYLVFREEIDLLIQ